MAIRVSLGAGRWRLTRQLLTESLFLAAAGACLGVAAAWWGVKGLIAFAPADTPLIGRASVDVPTLFATLGITVMAWLIFGLTPALRASAVAPASALQTSARNTASRSGLRLRHSLVIAQIAMAAVLVIFSGLLIRSFWRLRQISLGYEPRGAITLRVKLPETRYPFPKFPFREWPAVAAFNDRLKNAAKEIPGIQTVSLAASSPARTMWTTRVTVDGRPKPPEGEQEEAQFRTADPDYLKAAHIRLLQGRFFTESDDEKRPLVTVINEAFIRRHFPEGKPIGNTISVFGMSREVVGIIGDVRYAGPGMPSEPAMYFPLRQAPFPDLTLIVRSEADPASLAPALRRAVAAADPNVAPFDVMTLDRALLEATSRERFIMSLLTGFATLALLLASVGIYGVVAYSVGRRRQEIAVRMALGARALDVFSQIVGGTLVRTAVGVIAGIILALSAGRLLQPLVFETSTRDLTTYIVVASVLMAIAFLGAAVPATRATRVNAAITLREE
jgi:putative ABC transport system permease protein